ncbi:hypothetical protein BC829DRAFT_420808 [Chytridium lagenaria]|nr:hypothetical protein BC829DRAFT_420808 [Chytridium lagenaria]
MSEMGQPVLKIGATFSSGLRKMGPLDDGVNKLRLELRDRCEDLILRLDEQALEEAESNLWLNLHHSVINAYRKRLEAVCKYKTFYLRLVHKIVLLYKLDYIYKILKDQFEMAGLGPGDVPSTNVALTDELKGKLVLNCQRWIIHVGDLVRYRESLRSIGEKNWSAARNFYSLALHILPGDGYPYTQLALIDTVEEQHLLTVEHYLRW